MLRLSPLVRRGLASFAALTVLFAPLTQVAHAQAMTDAARHQPHAHASHQHASTSAPHSGQHQHTGTCCDFCGAGCTTPAACAIGHTSLAIPSGFDVPSSHVVEGRARVPSPPHILPFSLAPPRPTD